MTLKINVNSYDSNLRQRALSAANARIRRHD
jgi:hypothetical protein